MVTVSVVVPVFVKVKLGRLPDPLDTNPVTLGDDATAVQLKLAPATFDVQLTAVDAEPEQITSCSGVLLIRASGMTNTRYCTVSPVQLLAEGVNVTISVSIVLPVFTSVNDGMLPVPVAVNPVRLPNAAVAVQLIVVFATGVLGVTPLVAALEQICSKRGFTVTTGVGCTVTGISIGVPGHPTVLLVNVGVMVYTTFSVLVPVLLKVWLMVVPVPFDSPVMLAGAFTVHVNVVPLTLLDKAEVNVAPEHKMAFAGLAVALGIGFTVMV